MKKFGKTIRMLNRSEGLIHIFDSVKLTFCQSRCHDCFYLKDDAPIKKYIAHCASKIGGVLFTYAAEQLQQLDGDQSALLYCGKVRKLAVELCSSCGKCGSAPVHAINSSCELS